MADQGIPKSVNFLFGGSAGMLATCFVQPLDVVKNRLQLSGEGGAPRLYNSSFDAIRAIYVKEGFNGLFAGLSAGLLRQATYTTTRLGIYTTLLDRVRARNQGENPNFASLLAIGLVAGGCGAVVGTPAEISLIRMCADGRLPKEQQRGYTNVFNALSRITKEEGIATLWRGCLPTVGRAMVVNAAQLGTYSRAKQMLLKTGYFRDNLFCHFNASMISGLVTTIASMPVDIVKTRLQNMKVVSGVPEYSGAINCFTRVIKVEGVFSLWKGFMPYYFRLGPHTVLTFIFLEFFIKTYKKTKGIEGSSGGL
ncbi:mitochondrial 2-oxoglutarate/malate carrier protein [Lingula anatina]|uniref:Mitochondrial 2-oxoglutarate/malate carrier protein n=1 Tax=Lingula anatina TaxID=7574 RepID=A0A1S3JNF6_LINAN|nr:mitochondrial 2-oxoglutarate/malate carrier protein [Lingula anatina]|eukprot:XP_013411681.1 mitochondrial 2-oxoglutarate/malate carrier protein [Lingula anatina]